MLCIKQPKNLTAKVENSSITTATTATTAVLEWSQLHQRYQNEEGLSPILAAVKIRVQIDNGFLQPIDGDHDIKFLDVRNILPTPFQRRQKHIQENYLSGKSLSEYNAAKEEDRENEAAAKLLEKGYFERRYLAKHPSLARKNKRPRM